MTGEVEPVSFEIVEEIARGVPKSFPFHSLMFHFSAAGFSEGPCLPAAPDARTVGQLLRAGVDIGAGQPTSAGVSVKDAWWVNGRQRFVGALRIIEADPNAKKLPALPENVTSLFATCGKVRRTIQVPLVVMAPAAEPRREIPSDLLATSTGKRSKAWFAPIEQRYRSS
jgi:hypothetical protein